MQSDSAHGAQQREPYPGGRTGFRRLTPGLLAAEHAAEDFDGLPDGIEHHGALLAAFKAAAPRLGLSVRLVHALDWLFRFTRPQDWEAGSQPIVWPSAALQQEALDLSESGVQSINRGLIESGLVSMKDSANGKRYGVRDCHGQIVEAYGFDISPIAIRHAEFTQLAADAKAEREMIGRLRRRATIARKAIAQVLKTVAEYGFGDDAWAQLRLDCQALIKSLRRAERPEEITIGVGSLERRQAEARLRLQQQLDSSYTQPMGAENKAHIIPTKPASEFEQAVQEGAHEGPVGQPVPDPTPPDATLQRKEQNGAAAAPPEDPSPRLSIDDLVRVAPRLRTYLMAPRPTWSEIVNAADWLRGEMDISKSLWGEACLAMGREAAAVAVAVVSAKPQEHFRASAGGYFHGMVRKAKAGELNLGRTLWALRSGYGGHRPSNTGKTQPAQAAAQSHSGVDRYDLALAQAALATRRHAFEQRRRHSI